MELQHNWSQSAFEPSHLYQGYLTAIQFYECRLCREVVGLPLVVRPHTHGCTGAKPKEKVKWVSPMRERKNEPKKKDYPAKKKIKMEVRND